MRKGTYREGDGSGRERLRWKGGRETHTREGGRETYTVEGWSRNVHGGGRMVDLDRKLVRMMGEKLICERAREVDAK